ncbi:hypothetical protein [Rhodopseudomonas pseudopalustris]|uniref:hypothetical protein n=1 Tax=Rhodopseudomonas pseudopalustris TaxID=1513892 RepID=UPI000C9EF1AB
MCDYSLSGVASRPAKVAETLVSTGFAQTSTRGFASVDDEAVAVCMMPGTEIAFAHDVRVQRTIFRSTVHQKLARFRKINEDQPNQHHDALEFADGTVVLVNDLLPGQQAMVLQLPADAVQHGQEAERKTEAAPIAEPETERI